MSNFSDPSPHCDGPTKTSDGSQNYNYHFDHAEPDKYTDTIHYISPATTHRSGNAAPSFGEGEEATDVYSPFQQFYERLDMVGPCRDITASTLSCEEEQLNRTVAIVRPHAMKYQDVIRRAVIEEGLMIVDQRTVHFTPEQISEFYSQYYGSPAFPYLVVSMSSEPLLVMSLQGLNAVERLKRMTGSDGSVRAEWFYPYSMRIRFGLQGKIEEGVHGSENLVLSNKENRYVFPRNILDPILTNEAKVKDYCTLHLKETLLNGLAELVRAKPVEPIIYLAEWLLLNNPYQPRTPYNTAMTPT